MLQEFKNHEKLGTFDFKEFQLKCFKATDGKNAEQLHDDKLIIAYLVNESDNDSYEYIGCFRVSRYVETPATYLQEYCLMGVNVIEDYQEKGIGTKLVELAVKHLEDWKVAMIDANESDYGLSEEGDKLIASCIKSNVLPLERCMLPEETPQLIIDDNADDEDEDRDEEGEGEIFSGKAPAELAVAAFRAKKLEARSAAELVDQERSSDGQGRGQLFFALRQKRKITEVYSDMKRQSESESKKIRVERHFLRPD